MHVEQEVVGDDTTALQSVINSDAELCALVARKEQLEAQGDDGNEQRRK